MYTIDNLNVMLISELKEIAEGMGINAKKLGKQELVYKILDQQAVMGDAPNKKEGADKKEGTEPERK
ncbi:MAG: Rho termination factor N-terminal domain-containing protein, partial [Cytophagales bacterium]